MSDRATSNIAILSMGELKIALPQSQIISVDVVADTQAVPLQYEAGEDSALHRGLLVAVMDRQDGLWPVFTFFEDMALRERIPENYPFSVRIRQGETYYALACEMVEPLEIDASMAQRGLPDLMKTEHSPIDGLLRKEDQVVLLMQGESIYRYIESLGASDA